MKRLIRPAWYREHGAVIGYLVLSAAATIAIIGVLIIGREGQKSHDAVCALRTDLIRRVHDSDQFLKVHPHGIPGISRADIQRGIDGQRRTIHALRVADC